jgi:endoglucanase
MGCALNMSTRRWLLIVLCLLLVFPYARAQVCQPSANNSILSAPASTVLTDSNGNGWGIPVSGGQVFLQSTSLPWTSNAIQLAYVGGVMWYKNGSQQWYSLTSTGAIASGPQSGPPTNVGESIRVNSIGTQTAATSFVASGSIINATSTPVLNYSVNGGNFVALPGGSTITNTGSGSYTFSFTEPGMAQATSNTISMKDTNNGTVGTSNAFAVNGSGPTLSGTPMSPLPSGYLHVVGNQIQDGSGNNVRLSCSGYNLGTGNYGSDMAIMRAQGFNCVRFPWYDLFVCPNGVCNWTGNSNINSMDGIVAAATANNMKVVFDHHANEGTSNGGCHAQQANGLWYDKNSSTPVAGITWNSTDNTDGCGATGTVTYAQFKANWVATAAHYAGNSTVIAFDMDNEPHQPAGWGTNNGLDAKAMCSDTGAAVEAADPGVLIICEAVITYNSPFFNGVAWPSGGRDLTDLTLAGSQPVVLAGDTSNHVVYSVHDYPTAIGGIAPDSGPAKIAVNNTAWGYLVINNVAPVWIGEGGASLDGSDGNLADEQAWATTMTQYVNGQAGASGGPTFTGCQQPIGWDWWTFGSGSGTLNGTLNPDGTNKAGQQAYWSTLLYTTCSGQNPGGPPGGNPGVGGTTWNPNDLTGVTLSNGNLTATATGTHQGVRTTTSASAGKLCFEAQASTISSDWTLGLANTTFALNAGGGLGWGARDLL